MTNDLDFLISPSLLNSTISINNLSFHSIFLISIRNMKFVAINPPLIAISVFIIHWYLEIFSIPSIFMRFILSIRKPIYFNYQYQYFHCGLLLVVLIVHYSLNPILLTSVHLQAGIPLSNIPLLSKENFINTLFFFLTANL